MTADRATKRTQVRAGRSGRAGITRSAIVEAALAQLGETGIEGVTVRAVAGRLGVQAPALYWHVANKQELLDEMGTEIQRRIVEAFEALPAGSWRDGLAGYARIARAEYLRHRDGARTLSGTRLTDPEMLRRQEARLAAGVRAGIEFSRLVGGLEVITAFVVGFVIEEQERQGVERYDLAARDAWLGEEYPLVMAAGRLMFGDSQGRFERQLSMVLDGIVADTDVPRVGDGSAT